METLKGKKDLDRYFTKSEDYRLKTFSHIWKFCFIYNVLMQPKML